MAHGVQRAAELAVAVGEALPGVDVDPVPGEEVQVERPQLSRRVARPHGASVHVDLQEGAFVCNAS